jgi:hypothetical protein
MRKNQAFEAILRQKERILAISRKPNCLKSAGSKPFSGAI